MPTRFYFPATGSGVPDISPAVNSGWEQTAVTRLRLLDKNKLALRTALANASALTVPITTTQDIVRFQFVSEPLLAQLIDTSCTFSLVVRVFENATTNNVTLAVVVRVVAPDGTIRGTLFSNFNTGTEFALSAAAATRIVSATAVTAVTVQTGDRIVVEIGGHATAPTAAGSYTVRLGNNAATDFALTAALTTDLNPWCEFSQNLFPEVIGNFKSLKVGNGMSVTEVSR